MQIISTYLPYRFPALSPEETVRMMKDVGFTGLAVSWEEGIETAYGLPGAEQAALAERFSLAVDQAHLTIPGVGDLWYDDRRGDDAEARILREISEISAHQIPVVIMHTSGGPNAGPVGEAGLTRVKRIAEAAGKKGMRLALENSRALPHLSYAMDHIDSEFLGFCYDSGHDHEFTRGSGYLERYGNRLFAMHLNDNDGICDMHTLPFDGTLNWDSLIPQLAKTALARQVITLEPGTRCFTTYSSLDKAEILRRTRPMSIYGQEELFSIQEGRCLFYSGLTPLKYLRRAYDAALRIARKIDSLV